jgi:hypothetical protein
LEGKSIGEWFRNLRKSVAVSSTSWKTMVKYFPLIGEWIEWNIGDGWSVQVGEDPWEGSTRNFKLLEDLVRRLHAHGVFMLRDVAIQGMDMVGRMIWKSTMDLNLNEGLEE